MCVVVFTILLGCVLPASAKTPHESVQQAVLTHADVQSMIHAFYASGKEQEAAEGAYQPRIDISASVGWEDLSGSGYSAQDRGSYFRKGVYLLLNQMIYDGEQTRNKVRKMGHTRISKYYDLHGAMDKVALLAFRSHVDVARYREMLKLARENLERHGEIAKLVEERASAGLDSAIDREVVQGRLALAEVNFLTEESNLHDANTQYYRTVGVNPDELMEFEPLDYTPIKEEEEIIVGYLASNSRWLAARENVAAARYSVREQEGSLKPRLDLRAGYNLTDNEQDRGRRDRAFVELAMRYNLYDGGTERATLERFEEIYKQSEEVFKKTEQDIRQSLLIAYNEFHATELQLVHLKQHQDSSEAMEKAYRQQFEVGRRSLLDLLDAQNEHYQAKRAYRNSLYKLETAKVTYLAESGGILRFFNVLRDDIPDVNSLDPATSRLRKVKQ
ncbi:MAG: TolC family protein, partial [Fretibacterium sp.]|nr:TolC family protein [Fretibacterium sp.]